MAKVQIGVFARRNDDGSFLPSQPIYQEIEAKEGTPSPGPPYDDVAEMFYRIMKNAKAIKKRK